jgi:hypothetical protein
MYPIILSFSIALATLLLQLVQTRIYSVIYWNHLVYFIISLALLGFGISGTWLSLGKDTFIGRTLTMPRAAAGFIVSTILSTLLIPQLGLEMSAIFETKYLAGLFLTYVVAVLPYFFAGWILGSLFRDYAKDIHVLYFADLVGSACGCLIFLGGMRPLGAVLLIFCTCLVAGLPIAAANAKNIKKIPSLLLSLILVLCFAPAHGWINRQIIPESTKGFVKMFQDLPAGQEKVWEFSEWNPISRIDVVSVTDNPRTRIFIDGDAWTHFGDFGMDPPAPLPLDQWPPVFEHRSPYYFVQDPDNVLIIGAGGGTDIWTALQNGAKNVDAVEINPTTYRILKDVYREEAYEMAHRPGVELFNEEGRSFVSRTEKKYDVVMLHGIDTYAALNAGAYVLSENYLYTVDAVKDYISHLNDNGYLCITRWYHHAEIPRLFAVCMEALIELGVENPEKHIVMHGRRSGTILVSMKPVDETKLASFRDYIESINGLFPDMSKLRSTEFLYPKDNDENHTRISKMLAAYAEKRKAGTHEPYLKMLPINISPVYDDSPFFFHYDRFGDLADVFDEGLDWELIRGHWPSFTMFALIACTFVAVCLFMFIPLTRLGRKGIPMFGSHLIYFSCLGISFIFVEIALMQRFSLLLGHPSRSLALVLASLLFFAGVGSRIAGSPRIDLRKIMPVLVVLILVTTYLYPTLIAIALPWSLFLRGLVTIALVAPLGILMGMPFPTGLKLASRWGESAVPWMWGVNGGTTVLGSVVAILIAIHLSFTTVLLIAAAGYAVAWFTYARISTLTD